MRSFIAASLALAGVAAAASNSTVSAGSIFAPGYTQSCQAYYTECTHLSGRCTPGLEDCNTKCQTAYNNCRTGADANMATCAANYAGCLGTNPFAANNGTNNDGGVDAGAGTNTAGAGAGGVAVTTEVVTSFTTYCPYATQVTYNGQVYTASSATVLTITNCPCTITKAVSSVGATATGTGAGSNPTAGSKNGTYTPEAYTGAGTKAVLAGSSFIAGVAGLAIFL